MLRQKNTRAKLKVSSKLAKEYRRQDPEAYIQLQFPKCIIVYSHLISLHDFLLGIIGTILGIFPQEIVPIQSTHQVD